MVVVEPKPRKGLTSKVVDFVEKQIVKFMYDTSHPQHYLSGNFAPVPEETPPATNLLVKGFLPVRTVIWIMLIIHRTHKLVFMYGCESGSEFL